MDDIEEFDEKLASNFSSKTEEDIKHATESENEYLKARVLIMALGYTK